MWTVKKFKTREAMNSWIEKHGWKYQMNEIVANNAFALDIKPLRFM